MHTGWPYRQLRVLEHFQKVERCQSSIQTILLPQHRYSCQMLWWSRSYYFTLSVLALISTPFLAIIPPKFQLHLCQGLDILAYRFLGEVMNYPISGRESSWYPFFASGPLSPIIFPYQNSPDLRFDIPSKKDRVQNLVMMLT